MTPTNTPTATATPECPQGRDVCGVCGGKENDLSNCPGTQNCTDVTPTKEMKKISSELNKVVSVIQGRLNEDIKRASSYKTCRTVASITTYGSISTELKAIKAQIKKEILKTVQVCGEECLTLNFAAQVKEIRQLLTKTSKKTQEYAKKVVACSKIKKKPGQQNTTNTKQILDDAIGRTKNIESKCTICRNK